MAAAPSDLQVAGVLEAPATLESSRRRRRSWVRSLPVTLPAAALVALALACFVWPLIGDVPKPTGGSILDASLPIGSPGHPFGTDQNGNDILSRILYGGRVSLEVGVATQIIGLALGGAIGIVAGYRGGLTEAVVMRVLDVFIAFPSLVLAIAIAEGLGPSRLHVIWALSFFTIPAFARVTRASTLALRDRTYVVAAQLSGTPTWRILLEHILPNILPQLVTFGLLGAGVAINLEGALSFLGLGVPPPGASWGNMIADGRRTLSVSPELVLIPSAFLLCTVVALNLLGDGLRDRWGVR